MKKEIQKQSLKSLKIVKNVKSLFKAQRMELINTFLTVNCESNT